MLIAKFAKFNSSLIFLCLQYSIFSEVRHIVLSNLTLDAIKDCIPHCVPTIYRGFKVSNTSFVGAFAGITYAIKITQIQVTLNF